MAIAKIVDRVKETSLSSGTGNFILNGAVPGYRAFRDVIGDGETTFYCISYDLKDEWEIGIGSYNSASNTLVRDTILASSNNDQLVNFSKGVKSVFINYPAEKSVVRDYDQNQITLPNTTFVGSQYQSTISDGTPPLVVSSSTLIPNLNAEYVGNYSASMLSKRSTEDKTIYVDASSGNDTTGDGTSGNPYATINRALEDVPEVLLHNYTIQLSPGVYRESIIIKNNGLYASADSGSHGKLIIQGNAGDPNSYRITGANVGSETTPIRSEGIKIEGSAYVSLDGILIDYYTRSCIHVVGGQVEIKTVNLENTRYGLWGENGAYINLKDSILNINVNHDTNGIGVLLFRNTYVEGSTNSIINIYNAWVGWYQTSGTVSLTVGTITVSNDGATKGLYGINVWTNSVLHGFKANITNFQYGVIAANMSDVDVDGPSTFTNVDTAFDSGGTTFMDVDAVTFTNVGQKYRVGPGGFIDATSESSTGKMLYQLQGASPVASGSSAVAHWLDTVGSYSAGKLLSIRSGGSEKFYIAHDGNIYVGSNRVWHAGNLSKSEFAPANHNHDSTYLKLTGGAISGLLTVSRAGDGVELLRFDAERRWSFFQRGTGTNAALELRPEFASKSFIIANDVGTPVAEFYGSSIQVDRVDLIPSGGIARVAGNTIWHAGNLDPNSFATSGHNHDSTYLKLSGGTITGDLEAQSSVVLTTNQQTHNQLVLVNTQRTSRGRLSADGNGLYLSYNAIWDGSTWTRDDTTRPAAALVPMHIGSNEFQLRVAGAGTGSISWVTAMRISPSGSATFSTTPQVGSNQIWHAGNLTISGGGNAVGTSRQINAGTGLTGGGDLSANRTLSLDLTYTDGRYLRKDTDGTIVGSISLKASSSVQRQINIYTDDDAGKFWHFVARSVNYSNESRRHHFELMYNNGGTWQNILAINPTTRVVDFYVTPTVAGTPVALSDHNHDNTYLKLSGGAISGLLTVSRAGDGVELLRFDAERRWSFFQRGTGTNAAIELRPEFASKSFIIANDAGTPVAEFHGSSIQVDRVDLIPSGGIARVAGNTIWHAGNDGSGSGLDADTLDGQHASAFALVSHGHTVVDPLTTEEPETGRSVHATGVYSFRTRNTTTNKPGGMNYTAVLGFGRGVQGSAQIAIGWHSSDEGRVYVRSLRDTTDNWWPWRKVYTEKNPPTFAEIASKPTTLSGYGITDAYTKSEADSRYLRLTGGTITGTLEAPTLRLTATADASLASTGHALQIGPTSGENIIADGDEIMARNSGSASTLHLNPDGGDVTINNNAGGGAIWHAGNLNKEELAVVSLSDKTIYVNPSTGNDTTGDGTSQKPYKTINRALKDVPEVMTHNYTIQLASGTYNELVVVTKGGALAHAAGAGFATLTIRGDPSNPSAYKISGGDARPFGMIVSTPFIFKLEGVQVENSTSAGLYALSTYLKFHNVNFNNNLIGMLVQFGCMLDFNDAGTINITGKGPSFGNGINMEFGGHMRNITGAVTINISEVKVGYAGFMRHGINATFTNATWNITNSQKVSGSYGFVAWGSGDIHGLVANITNFEYGIEAGNMINLDIDSAAFDNVTYAYSVSGRGYMDVDETTFTNVTHKFKLDIDGWIDARDLPGVESHLHGYVGKSTIGDGSTAVAHWIDTLEPYTTNGAKLFKVSNAGEEKFYIAHDGKVSVASLMYGGQDVSLGDPDSGGSGYRVLRVPN